MLDHTTLPAAILQSPARFETHTLQTGTCVRLSGNQGNNVLHRSENVPMRKKSSPKKDGPVLPEGPDCVLLGDSFVQLRQKKTATFCHCVQEEMFLLDFLFDVDRSCVWLIRVTHVR